MAHRQERKADRQELVAEFDGRFPPSLFRALRPQDNEPHGNEQWKPRRVVRVSVIMFWVAGNTLEDQFSAALRICFSSTCGLPVVLITNVLNAERLSDQGAPQIDRSRWGMEVDFRHLQQTLGFIRVKSHTPSTALHEHRNSRSRPNGARD